MSTRVIVTPADARGVEARLVLRVDSTAVTADSTIVLTNQGLAPGASPVSVSVLGEARVARALEG